MIIPPCIEQPLRVIFHCNGYYLCGLRKGQVITRRQRSEQDEFLLVYKNINGSSGIVEIYNHKHGGILTVITKDDGNKNIVCIQDSENNNVGIVLKEEDKNGNNAPDNDESLHSGAIAPSTALLEMNNLRNEAEALLVEEDQNGIMHSNIIQDKDKQWYFVRVGDTSNNKVLIKSLSTGEYLGIDDKGNIAFASDNNNDDKNNDDNKNRNTIITRTWDIECVTGELCYISNTKIDCRIRCDINGSLSPTDSRKGWEVFRFIETSHGYVKISSWMHTQWILCSTRDGVVSTCQHSESFLDDDNDDKDNDDNGYFHCCKWAILKANDNNGVIIRSKKYNRLLCFHDGIFKTYDPNESRDKSFIERENNNENNNMTSTTNNVKKEIEQDDNNDDDNDISQRQKWWNNNNNSFRNINESMKNSMITLQKQFSRVSNSSMISSDVDDKDKIILQKETIMWQLDAAHLQTYYFINTTTTTDDDDNDNDKSTTTSHTKSIGPFPEVSSNLRKTDKIQIIRNDDENNNVDNIIKLYLIDSKQHISCLSNGMIELVDDFNDSNNDWIMEKSSSQQQQIDDCSTTFRSKLYNFYLSHKEEMIEVVEKEDKEIVEEEPLRIPINKSFDNLFNRNKKEKVSKLVGSKTINKKALWRLEPSMPRAVDSQKIKTFAVGTSIAVGTSLAMPFALAGVGAVLGAHSVAAHAIFFGITGAEALSTFGAIGATAYIVFRPDGNSLTDDLNKNEDDKEKEEEERARSKRPFSNWKNW